MHAFRHIQKLYIYIPHQICMPDLRYISLKLCIPPPIFLVSLVSWYHQKCTHLLFHFLEFKLVYVKIKYMGISLGLSLALSQDLDIPSYPKAAGNNYPLEERVWFSSPEACSQSRGFQLFTSGSTLNTLTHDLSAFLSWGLRKINPFLYVFLLYQLKLCIFSLATGHFHFSETPSLLPCGCSSSLLMACLSLSSLFSSSWKLLRFTACLPCFSFKA